MQQPLAQPQIAVAHSFGLHLLAEQVLAGVRLLVVLGGFQAFHPEEERAGRRSRRLVVRQRQRLASEPEALLADFYAQCFSPEIGQRAVPLVIGHQTLAADLERLDAQTLDLSPLRALPQILLLHGTEDQIVPVERAQELHRQLPKSRLQLIGGASHALPLTRASRCWAHLWQAWEELGP